VKKEEGGEEEEEQEEVEEANDNDNSSGSVDNDDKNNKNNFTECSTGLDTNKVSNIHRDSKPNTNKHLYMFIYDYYQVAATVNHD
jgi:hypothetical protein